MELGFLQNFCLQGDNIMIRFILSSLLPAALLLANAPLPGTRQGARLLGEAVVIPCAVQRRPRPKSRRAEMNRPAVSSSSALACAWPGLSNDLPPSITGP